MTNPEITVLMAVCNGEKYLREAINSILNQTFRDFIFLIIDDGSTDSTSEIIKSYTDPRVKLVVNGSNIGQLASLNKGFKLIETPFVARMDADDISMPDRIEILYRHIRKGRNISVVSCNPTIIDENGNTLPHLKNPLDVKDIKFKALFDSPVNHGGSLMRVKHIREVGLYNPKLTTIADLDLWVKLLAKKYLLLNIPEYLLKVRWHSQSQSESAKVESRCDEYSYTLDYYIRAFTPLKIDYKQVRKIAFFLHYGAEFNETDLNRIQANFRNILENLNFEYPTVKKAIFYHHRIACYHYKIGVNHIYKKAYIRAQSEFVKAFFAFPFMIKSLFAIFITFTGKTGFCKVKEFRKSVILRMQQKNNLFCDKAFLKFLNN